MRHEGIYTDAPALHRNLIVGSLQLLFWLFFHPSAWRNHIRRIDPHLSPNFCFAELRRQQWREFSFLRLLLMSALIWPLLVGLLVGLVLWLVGLPAPSIVLGIIIGLALGIVTSSAVSLVGSVPIGVAMGMAVAVVTGVGSGLVFGATTAVALETAANTTLTLSTIIGLAGGLAGGLGFGVAAGLTSSAGTAPNISIMRRISGAVIGIVIGAISGRLANVIAEQWMAVLILGVPFGLAIGWRTGSWQRGAAAGLVVAVLGVLAALLAETAVLGTLMGTLGLVILLGSLFALPYVLAERVAGPAAGALAGALGSGGGIFLFVSPDQPSDQLLLFSLVGVLLGLTLAWWRPVVMYPLVAAWNLLLLRLDERRLPQARPSLLPWHSAFWDEAQRLSLISLDAHLLLVMAYRPREGVLALDYLSASRQRWAAQAAQIEWDARLLAECGEITAVSGAYEQLGAGELTGPASALLRSFSRISQDVGAALRQESAYNQRLALSAVEDRLDGLVRELTRSNERYAARFRPIAGQWRQVVSEQSQKLAEEAELRQEIDSPYIIGVPLTEQQEIFVGRHEISARIEQLLLDRRQPPLFLYGQRRVGKTSLLNNLGRLLPSTIVPLFVDLQGPASRARNEAGFLYNVTRSMRQSAERQRGMRFPDLDQEALTADPFTRFEEWLDAVEAVLGDNLALLMLDEFEVLEGAFAKGRFEEEAILGTLRHLIQHRPRFKVLISGSHTLDEFQRWASYLINVQVIHIGYLGEAETRQLVEKPVVGFALRYEAAASQHVLGLTRGHPFLVQLLCAEVVALKNEQPPEVRRLAGVEDVETAVSSALDHGSFFFADIQRNQVNPVEQEVLRLLARGGGTAVARQQLVAYFPSLMALEEALVKLQQRELIEPVADGYRFQIELVRRWFAAQV
ncbi:MAG: ATP-binding protein [Ardenticatenaceae bacterium]|nr:ATP-binding protein [Ardenticatenaceae bacterium]